MRALLVLFCCFSVIVSAQAPYLQRTGSENSFRRIDPFGSLPSTFNNPLPFAYGFSTTSPVQPTFPQADYFVSATDDLWEYESTHQFLCNELGTIQEERHVNKFTGQLEKQIIYERTGDGLLVAVSEYAVSNDHQTTALTARRLLTYEAQSNIILSDSTIDLINGASRSKGIRITRNPDNSLKHVAVYSEINGTISHQGFFEFSYKGNSLDEIIQFHQDEKGNRLEPVFRFYNLSGTLSEPFQITGYTSAWMENGQWKDFRIDKSQTIPSKKIFEAELLSGVTAGMTIENTIDIDQHNNVSRISQKRSLGSSVELIGELTYELSYDDGQAAPSIITTTYRDELGNKKNSLRVVENKNFSPINTLGAFSLAVFPNPATDFITVQWQSKISKPLVFELVTATGTVAASLTTENWESASASLSLKGIAPGFYRLNGYQGEQHASAPLIILERK